MSSMLEGVAVLLGIELQGALEGADALRLGAGDNLHLGGVAQGNTLNLVRLVENVVLHDVVSSFRIVRMLDGTTGSVGVGSRIARLATILGGLFEHDPHSKLLLGSEGFPHILDGLVGVSIRLGVALGGIGIGAGIAALVGMAETDGLAGSDDDLVLCALTVGQVHKVDERSGIGPGDDQAEFTNIAVDHVLAAAVGLLFQPVGVDRQGLHVAMLYQLLGGLAALRLVEEAIGIHAVLPVLQNGVTQDVGGVIVLVVPHDGNRHPVAVLESVAANRASVGADNVISGCPATKVILQFHFEYCPPLVL